MGPRWLTNQNKIGYYSTGFSGIAPPGKNGLHQEWSLTMKKNSLRYLLIIMTLLASSVAFGEDSTKIGVIDLQKCLEESREGKKVSEILKKKKAVLQTQLDKKQKELLELRKEFEKQAMMLSMDAQEDKRKTIERKTRELEYLLKDLNEEMARAQEREKRRIFKELGDIIQKIGSAEGFTLIMEKRAGGLLYFTEAIDLTVKIIAEYDQTKAGSKE
jgi:outer membrane protein